MTDPEQNIVWAPQEGPQQALIDCPLPLIGYGGARGGGKTDGVLGKFAIKAETMGEKFNGIFFRKELPQADDLIERAKQIYLPLEAHYNDQKKQFTFAGGGRLRFRPLANNSDAEKYQGQNLCVAVGTRIRMADGSFKEIQEIKINDEIATLSGPKKVTKTIEPYLAPCVRSVVSDQDGNEIGNQIHPVWHPVLTAYGISSSVGCSWQHTTRKHCTSRQSKQSALDSCSAFQELFAHGDLKCQAWFSYLGDEKTYYTMSEDDIRELQQLEGLSVPVVLHEPTVRLSKKRCYFSLFFSNLCRFPGKFFSRLLDSSQVRQMKLKDCLQRPSPFQQSQVCYAAQTDDASNAQTNLKTTVNSQSCCQYDHHLRDEHFHQASKNVLNLPRLLNDVVGWFREKLWGESGTTQTHSHVCSRWWVHPYTYEAKRLAEDIVYGKMVASYIGPHMVADITVEDANHYIGDSGLINKNSDAAIEEAGNYPSPDPIFKLFGALRGTEVQMILTFNPGGPGHWWLKEKFIKPAPKGWELLKWKIGTGKEVPYIYIPSRVQDNKILLHNDPEYIDRLHMVGSPELVRAWLEGDFEIHEGSYFPEFSTKHILSPFTIPKHWPRYLGYDWGYRSPFAAVWGAVCSGKGDDGGEVEIPRGAIVIYRELHGTQIDNKEQAERIASLSVGEDPIAVADPSIFKTDGGPSINDQLNAVFAKYKHPSFRRADNDRVSGWSQIRQRLQADPPLLYISTACPYLIESLPALQLCQKNHEDADTTGDDHAADALRYLCKERLMQSEYEKPAVKSIEKGRVKLQLYVNEVRRKQKAPKL